uniref:Uncharacterized protein n=1 Tax=Romanomermis culicivorax TaxID=13658 RepID=A0A915L8K7_ROMCU
MKPPVDNRADQATDVINVLPSTNFSKTSKSFDSLRFEGPKNDKDSTAMTATKKFISIPLEENNSGSIICPKNANGSSIFFDNLLSQHVAVGHFLSRSQDSLTKISDPNSISVLLSTTSSGHVKNEKLRSTVKQKLSKNVNSLSNTNRTMSSAQLGAVQRVHSPLVEKSVIGEPPSIQGRKTFSKSSNGNEMIHHSNNITNTTQQKHQQVDPRITRTKMTVTELQKQKQDLEAYVTELVKKAEHKQAELANMKIEIRRLKEEKGIEYEKLRQENQNLKRLLTPDDATIDVPEKVALLESMKLIVLSSLHSLNRDQNFSFEYPSIGFDLSRE